MSPPNQENKLYTMWVQGWKLTNSTNSSNAHTHTHTHTHTHKHTHTHTLALPLEKDTRIPLNVHLLSFKHPLLRLLHAYSSTNTNSTQLCISVFTVGRMEEM